MRAKAQQHGFGGGKAMATNNILDSGDTASLLFMIEEEKMARDVYDALYEQTGLKIFDNISNSEQKHLDALLNAAAKLGVDTSALNVDAGVFVNTQIADLYIQLLAQGSVSTTAALEVGVLIEATDIADLQETIATVDVTLLGQVYANLLNGSENHINAFESQIA
jgi:hypothetical protein